MNEAFDKKRNRDIKGIKETQKLKLGDAQGTPRKYFKKSQASNLGDAPVGIPPFFFNNYRLVSVEVFKLWVRYRYEENKEVGGQAVLGRQSFCTTPWLTERHGLAPHPQD